MKFGNMKDWQSDAQLEMEGVRFDIGRERWLTMRRAGGANRPFMVEYAALISRLANDSGSGPDGVVQALISEELQPLFAEYVIIGWGGIEDEKGREVPFSKEAFLELVKSAPDLWIRIRAEADKRERFQREHLEREKTALGKSSNGKQSGVHTARA